MIRTKRIRPAPAPVRRQADSLMEKLARQTGFADPRLTLAWPEIVGPEHARLGRPGKLSGGRRGRTLEIFAPDGARAARLEFEAGAIIEALNRYYGPGTIGHLHIRQYGAAARPARNPARPDERATARAAPVNQMRQRPHETPHAAPNATGQNATGGDPRKSLEGKSPEGNSPEGGGPRRGLSRFRGD